MSTVDPTNECAQYYWVWLKTKDFLGSPPEQYPTIWKVLVPRIPGVSYSGDKTLFTTLKLDWMRVERMPLNFKISAIAQTR